MSMLARLTLLVMSFVWLATPSVSNAGSADPRHGEPTMTQSPSPEAGAFAKIVELPDEPFVMLNLLAFKPNGGAEAYAKYGQVALPHILKRGGKILYQGRPLVNNPESGRWDNVVLVYYPSPTAFLDMMQDEDYQSGLGDRTAGLERTVVYAFSQSKNPGAPPLEVVPTDGGDEIFVLNLMRFKPNGGREDYAKYGAVVRPMLGERGASPVLVLDGQVSLVSDETWEDLYLVRYPSLGALQGMVATEAWQKANEDRQRGLDLTWAFPTQP